MAKFIEIEEEALGTKCLLNVDRIIYIEKMEGGNCDIYIEGGDRNPLCPEESYDKVKSKLKRKEE
jgi:hypothetical protein